MLTTIEARLAQCSDLSVDERIDVVCDCFENDWKQGVRPEIATYLAFCDETIQPRLLTELLLLDWDLRTGQGEQPSWDEYLTKLPRFANQIEAAKFKLQAHNIDQNDAGQKPQVPTRVGRFELLEKLGSGASGEVWKAHDTLLRRTVAAKIPRNLHLSEEELSRFLREGQSAAELKHPNIAAVHEVGYAEGTAYLISDFIAGQDLKTWLKQSRPSFEAAAEICRQIARALTYAHSHGVIHRDLKPANVLLDENSAPHLVDFGLAKRFAAQTSMSTQHQLVGTPAYMSPEQARGQRSDPRSDVYSLGVMLYEMISGQQPFSGNLDEVICALLTKEPVRPRQLNKSIPRDLELICLKAIAQQPAARYQTAEEMERDLSCYLRGEPIHARRYRRAVLAWRAMRRQVGLMCLALVLCMVVFSLVVLMRLATRAGRQNSSLLATETRNVHLRTVPATDKVIFVPLSPGKVDPVAAKEMNANGLGQVEIKLTPGDYWIEVLWPDGRFHDVIRHVPCRGEKSSRPENHLSWTETVNGTVELPDVKIPPVDVTEGMMLIDEKDPLAIDDSRNDESPNFGPFYIAQKLAAVREYQHVNRSLPAYLSQVRLQPDQPIPLEYDDAVSFAEQIGMRLATKSEWDRAHKFLSLSNSNRLAVWTSTPGVHASIVASNQTEQSNEHLRIVVGGSGRVIRQEGALQEDDFSADRWAAIQRNHFFPGVGVLCVRSARACFFDNQ